MGEHARHRWGGQSEVGTGEALGWLFDSVPLVLFSGLPDAHRTVLTVRGDWIGVMGRAGRMFVNGELTLLDITHPDDLASVVREIQSATLSWRPYQIGYRVRDPGGHYAPVWELGTIQPGPTTGAPEVQGCIISLGHAPFLQEQAVVGRTAAGLAHDLRNLLAVVSGAAELISETGTPSEAGGEPARALVEATQTASRLATQLGRLLSGKPATLTRVDLNDVVLRMQPVLRALAGKQVVLHTTLDPDLDPTLADPVHLDQLLLNLVVNAVEAMPDGGMLDVSTTNLLVSETRELSAGWLTRGAYVLLSVSDTGTGIPDEALRSVFEATYSTKGSRGLGLANVLEIAHSYSGTVDVQSAQGQGSTFRVYLPRVVQTESHPVSQWRLR